MIKYFLTTCLALISICTYSQKKYKAIYPIAFYNVENLFDTERDHTIQDEDYTPNGKNKWTTDKYQKKLSNLAYVINQLGTDIRPEGVAILGVAEVENLRVMKDLINAGELSKRKYDIVHYDSPDGRGIDVGLIYDKQAFKVLSHKTYPFTLPGGKAPRTRDILVVSGILDGEPISILVNHWPSRRGEDSEQLRERAGKICKHITDSIYKKNSKAGIVIMGDMNDDPKDRSTRVALGAKQYAKDTKRGELYNPMWNIHNSGMGSLKYKGEWNLFDQIIISESLLKKGKSKFNFERAEIFNKDFLFQKSGNYQGYPLRTFSGSTFLNGYSDHLPTLIYLSK